MFSGIVETTAKLIKSETLNQAERIWIEKPHAFDDLSVGDSICTNGVCLTVEAFDEKQIQFCLGAETLSLLKQSLPYWKDKPLNLERSLKFGDRVHGHLVTGHVDQSAQIVVSEPHGDVWDLAVEASDEQARYFWKKGSACVNGVSLTINKVAQNKIYFCLIPGTLKITNLQYYKVGDFVNLESDYLAKAYIHSRQEKDL